VREKRDASMRRLKMHELKTTESHRERLGLEDDVLMARVQ